ncbi:hypothetical protein E2605_18910 [Dysgonomonas capnocytophagoides]|jgi:hypothetical protein|uniref:Uncharacterized protein n=1 Tax=Dysgonomonas capnocytophagoides TaxID=45254 RepID=A0A4Y8KSN4_9BACT|nr:hypothetical protein [Dysgonomonas capnocytophagoides]TFD92176.1 hypothetical protein E2605_18910 [Dysgonomonas capnocytophagoides]
MIFNIDDIIPFSKRHPRKTIREILLIDSGYLKDLIKKNSRVILSEECYQEAILITKGMRDEWVKPIGKTESIFDSLKPYTAPYGFDFNDEELITINRNRLEDYKGIKNNDFPF